jgi:hypothetical protein
VLTVWLINQIIGFSLLHYPTDASTTARGLALGVIGLLSLCAAFLALARLNGFVGILASFLAAFVVYEGAIFVACVASGTGIGSFTALTVTRIFLINAASFGGLLAARELWRALPSDAAGKPPPLCAMHDDDAGGGRLAAPRQ